MWEEFILQLKKLQNIWYRLDVLKRDKFYYCIIVIVLFLLALIFAEIQKQSTTKSTETNFINSKEQESLDTMIPKGFVLIPIEIQNLESLDSIFGAFGVVDLYSSSDAGSGQKKTLIARRIKLLRAPYNPNIFAVLAPENFAEKILQHNSRFFVSLQNPSQEPTKYETNQKTIKVQRIEQIQIDNKGDSNEI